MVNNKTGDHAPVFGILRLEGITSNGRTEVIYGIPEYDGDSVRSIAAAIKYMLRYWQTAREEGYVRICLTHEDVAGRDLGNTDLLTVELRDDGVYYFTDLPNISLESLEELLNHDVE